MVKEALCGFADVPHVIVAELRCDRDRDREPIGLDLSCRRTCIETLFIDVTSTQLAISRTGDISNGVQEYTRRHPDATSG
jgi:hypothetical protein